VFLTGCVYWQIRHHGPVNTDDFHLTESKYLSADKEKINTYSYRGLFEGMTTIVEGVWMPLIYMTVGAEMEFFGTDFGAYHVVSVCVHAVNAIILFLLLHLMTRAMWKSAVVAAIFAVHPLNVEPVAWLACIRVLQGGCFCLLTLYFYALYASRRSSVYYTLSLFWYAASLFSVPMFPAMPFLLLLLDFWPWDRLGTKEKETTLQNLSLKKIGQAVWEKFPFFGIMTVVLTILIFSHDLSSSPGIERYPFHERFFNIFLSYAGYIQQVLLPVNLAVYYPFPESFPAWKICSALLLMVIITVASLRLIRNNPFLIVGWLWFAGMMFPLSGIAQIGTQSRADHYAYIPVIGLLIFICWGSAATAKQLRTPRTLTALVSITVIALLTFSAWQQAGCWKNSIALMHHALKVTDDNYEAHNYLAQAHATRGDLKLAVDHFQHALSIKPDHLKSHINLAGLYAGAGQMDKAISHFTEALAKNPNNERLHNNLGALYEKSNDIHKAFFHYRRAIMINPAYAVAYDNLAVLEANTGNISRSIFHFQQALLYNPRAAGVHFRLAMVLHKTGRTAEAVNHLGQALYIDPGNRQYRQFLTAINRD